jgi:hypothetical protein
LNEFLFRMRKFYPLVKAAKIRSFRFHDLRHTLCISDASEWRECYLCDGTDGTPLDSDHRRHLWPSDPWRQQSSSRSAQCIVLNSSQNTSANCLKCKKGAHSGAHRTFLQMAPKEAPSLDPVVCWNWDAGIRTPISRSRVPFRSNRNLPKSTETLNTDAGFSPK